MASTIDIVNKALGQLGEAALLNLSDDSPHARLANRTYDDLRKGMLREHPWNFAMKRDSLAASTVAPAWEFTNAYPVPDDFLRLVSVHNPSKYDYRIERTSDGTVIVTDLGAPLLIKYTADIELAGEMDPSFIEALAARCAVEWADAIKGDANRTATLVQLYQKKLRDAKSIDGQEDYPTVVTSDEWLLARY
jgi:hypothetical protein